MRSIHGPGDGFMLSVAAYAVSMPNTLVAMEDLSG